MEIKKVVSFFASTPACTQYDSCIVKYIVLVGADTSDPAMMALQMCYSNIKNALDTHLNTVVSLSFSQCLIPSDIHSTIISSPSMPSGDKVNMFLNAVERQISVDGNSVKVLAGVLRDQGSYLSVIGSDLENTYCECHNICI